MHECIHRVVTLSTYVCMLINLCTHLFMCIKLIGIPTLFWRKLLDMHTTVEPKVSVLWIAWDVIN